MGIILYEMIYGTWPFYAKTEPLLIQEIIKNAKNKAIILPASPTISKLSSDIILRMLKFEEVDRISWD